MTQTRAPHPTRVRIADVFAAAPLAWLLYLTVPSASIFGALADQHWHVPVSVWLIPLVLVISLLTLLAALHGAGLMGRWSRVVWSAASVGVGAGIALVAYQSNTPDAHALPLLAIPAAVFLLLPLVGASHDAGERGADSAVWRQGVRLLLGLVPAAVLCVGISLLAGCIASITADSWPAIAALSAFFTAMGFTTLAAVLGVATYITSTSGPSASRLSALQLQLLKIGFCLTGLATIAGSIGLFVVRAFGSGTVIGPEDVALQGGLLTAIALVGPASLFLGAPFVDRHTGLRGGMSRRLGTLMRLFPPAFVVLLAWSSPAVFSSWAVGQWTAPERMGACLIGATTAYCVLRTVFDVLRHRLPLWLLPAIFAGATLACGLTYV